MRELNKLNKAQREAVEAIEGPVMVVAGPGTGKTTILTLRIANILKTAQADPENILALTYTTSGAISMREKLRKIIGDDAYRVNISTFHSFCEHIFSEFPFYFEYLEGARVVSDIERIEMLEEILGKNKKKLKELKSFSVYGSKYNFLDQIVSAILNIKKEGLSPEEFEAKIPKWKDEMLADEDIYYKKNYSEYQKGDIKPSEKDKIEKSTTKAYELGEIFRQYQEELHARGLYDFSDMILSVISELKENESLKADLSERYQYILLDEHQDTNEGQNKIVELLTDAPHLERKPNLFTVGDEKQSIYRFQGASQETFDHFHKIYKDIQEITLTENYRSGGDILDGSHSLITKTKGLENSVKLNPNSKGDKIKVLEFSNYKFELLYLVEDIQNKIKSGVDPSEIAVLYRANSDILELKPILDFYEVPYTVFSKDAILEDPNIRNLIHLMRVVNDMNNDASLGKAMLADFLNLDSYDVVKIMEKFRSLRKKEKKHILAIMEDKKTLKEIEVKNAKDFENLVSILKDLKKDSENEPFQNFFKIFLDKIGYLEYMLEAKDSRLQLAKLDKLFDEIKKQIKTKKGYSLSDFIYFIDAYEKYNIDIKTSDPEIVEGVNLMTAHGSKGREFEYVYIIDATRKSWEKRRSRTGIKLPVYQYDGGLEDERRLFYVAMTRAKAGLTISYSRTDNDGKEHEASEFVREISEENKEEQYMEGFEASSMDKLSAFMSMKSSSKEILEPSYIKELFFKRRLNVSALNNYLDCPKKYLYRNLIQLPDTLSVNLIYGSIIDGALNDFFGQSKQKGEILPKKVLLEEFEKHFNKYYIPEEHEEEYLERGAKALEAYYDEYTSSWHTKIDMQFHARATFGLETGDELTLSGSLDKVEYLDDLFSPNINIIDHKTGKTYSEKTKDQRENYERQLVFYKLLMEGYEKKDFKVNKTILDFVEKNAKKDKFERHEVEVSGEQVDKLKAEINKMADEVLSMKFLELGCAKRDCQWCKM